MRRKIVRGVSCALVMLAVYGCAGVRFGEYSYYPAVPYEYSDPYSDYYYYNYYNFYYPYGYYAPYEPREPEERREREKPEEYRQKDR
ncbi:MAG TPA: hypothetical protein VED67_00105 [Thermodesulfovibrionales bacterium]|nr:hypothetical protein [Thermodesulfovibrionales bacterium]